MNNEKLHQKIKDNFNDGLEAAIENIKDEINSKVTTRIDGLEQYVRSLVLVLEELVKK